MKKLPSIFCIALALCAMDSCKNGNTNNSEAPLAAGMVRIDLSKWHLPATIDIPDTTRKVYGFVENSDGSLLINVGKGFYVSINVSGEPMSMKKNDINSDDLNKPKTWVVSDSNSLLYSTQKDTNAFANAKEEFHFYCVVKKGTATYYVQELTQGADGTVYTFSKEQAQTMFNSAKTLTPVAPPAKN